MRKPSWLRILALLPLLFGAKAASGQDKHMAIEASFFHSSTFWGAPFGVSLGWMHGRSQWGLDYGWFVAAVRGNDLGVHYRRYLHHKDLLPERFTPYISTSVGFVTIAYSPLFRQERYSYSARLNIGCKWMIWRGVHFIGETGFAVQKLDLPLSNSPAWENRLWIRPSILLGMGYTLGLRPWQQLRPEVAPFPPNDMPDARHSLTLLAGRTVYFLFRPTTEYRLQYGYTVHPALDLYAGIDLNTTRWFFPTEAGRDSIQVSNGRLGLRFFPAGRNRLQYFAEAALAFGRPMTAQASGAVPGSTNLQAILGSGLRFQLHKGLHVQTSFYHRRFRVFPDQFGLWLGESGIDFGISYVFATRMKSRL